MLVLLVVVMVLGSLLVEWMIHQVRDNYELDWSRSPLPEELLAMQQPAPETRLLPHRLNLNGR